MLFNSYVFLFGFLPLVLLLFHGLRRRGRERGAVFMLAVMSLAYYGWWSWIYLLLLIPLMMLNYIVAQRMVDFRARQRQRGLKRLLILGLSVNLAALGYYKYANFYVDNITALFGLDLFFSFIVLLLGFTFFTIQKIALLVDVYNVK